jgi:hypothetical protein
MVSEKIAAAAAAQAAAARALVGGKGIETAATVALAPVKRAVRANHRRLSRAKKIDGVIWRLHRLLPPSGVSAISLMSVAPNPLSRDVMDDPFRRPAVVPALFYGDACGPGRSRECFRTPRRCARARSVLTR